MKHAIVFSAENQIKPGSNETSSGYEKMAIALAYSVRDCMPDVDIYCATFTSNRLSDLARKHFERLNVVLIEDIVFPLVSTDLSGRKIDNVINDYYTFNGFLRNYAKHYFSKTLLDSYDYLIYTDIDVLWFKEPNFDFNPTDPIALIEPTPAWCKKFLSKQVADNLEKNLYLNWVDIINRHNCYLFDMDYSSKEMQTDHASDVVLSARIDNSSLTKIEQQFGGYGVDKPPTAESVAFHYDSLGAHGTLYLLEQVQPLAYKKYMLLFDKVLNVNIINEKGYWETVREKNK